MPTALEMFIVPDSKDETKAVAIYCYGFKPSNAMEPMPVLTDGNPVPVEALVVQTVGGITTVAVSLTKLIGIYGPVNALLKYTGLTV